MKKPGFIFFLLLLSSNISFAQQFKFVVWGDSQFQSPDVFEQFVHATELLKPALVLHTGDMIHGYTYNIENAKRQWKRFKKQIAPLSAPFYPTPGNHDITTKEIQPAYLEAWGNDKLYYSFDHENSHYIVLNPFINQLRDSLPQEELDWLKADLIKAKSAKNIFVTMHSPLHLSNKTSFKLFHEIIKKYPVKGVFTGHNHIYDYRVIDGIPYFCINTSGNMTIHNIFAARAHMMLYVTVNGDNVDYAVITKDQLLGKDDVLPGDAERAAKAFEADKTILIPDPSERGFTEVLRVPIINRSDTTYRYKIQWNTNDFRWGFEPLGSTFALAPGEEKVVEYKITAPADNFLREDLPYITVSSPYRSLKGIMTERVNKIKLFYPPVTHAYRLKDKITLDGKIDEPQWKNRDGIDNLYVDERNTPAEEKTSVRVLYDEKYIYIGIRGEEPAPQKLSAVAYGDIPLVFGDDDFEVYLDNDSIQSTFYRFMVNPKGTVLNSGPKGLFTVNFDVKTFIGNDFWSAEFRIPFAEMKAKAPAGTDKWRFNVRRHRQQAEAVQSDWSKMAPLPPYQTEFFGVLKFLQ